MVRLIYESQREDALINNANRLLDEINAKYTDSGKTIELESLGYDGLYMLVVVNNGRRKQIYKTKKLSELIYFIRDFLDICENLF